MATEWQLLGSAINTRLASVTGSGTVSIYQEMAPQGTLPPYFIFARLTSFDEYAFNKRGFSTRYLFKAVSNADWPDKAQGTYAFYEPYIQDAPLSVSGYRLIRCRRVSSISYPDNHMFWHCGAEYEIEIQPT